MLQFLGMIPKLVSSWVVRRLIVVLILFSILSIYLYTHLTATYADEIEDLKRQIDELSRAREQSVAATKPLEGQLDSLKRQLSQIQQSLDQLSLNLQRKQKELDLKEERLVLKQVVLEERVRSLYKRSYLATPLLLILSSLNSTDLFRELIFRQNATKEDRQIITLITQEVLDLLTQKENLENDKAKLSNLQAQVDKNAQFLGGEIQKAKKYQEELSGKIAELTARQQAILAAKSGTFTTSVGDVPLADDPKARPDFNPGFSPAFGAFSFGAYTHRNGMSQYGAKGRAEAGQSAEQILAHYYPGANLNKNYNAPGSITVSGFGTIPFEETYMKRIYEMPNSFPKEALKAQAVAARSYALRYTSNGANPICATQSCQVYKNENKGGAWEEVVTETKGWVLEGGPNAQYSSTTGGYLNNSGWDTVCSSQGCWTQGAYEKMANSPWFYKGWYTQSYWIGSATCGRSHPWLNLEETADILNAYLVSGRGGVDGGRITPVTTACWGGNPYSMGELASLANSAAGGAVTSISGVSVSYSTAGSTASVSFSTNRGTISLSGADFKTIFNLRAPGYISVRSPLFNIERK